MIAPIDSANETNTLSRGFRGALVNDVHAVHRMGILGMERAAAVLDCR
jgi:hypothetical protein